MRIICDNPRVPVLAPNEVQASALKLWVRSTDLALSNGAAVSTWTDQSGTSHNLTQATTTNQPAFTTNVFGTRPGVFFTTDDYLICDSIASSYLSGSDMPFTVYMVLKWASVMTSFCPFSAGRSSSATPYIRLLGNALQRTDDANSTVSISITGMNVGPNVMVTSFPGTSASVRRDARAFSGALDVGTITLDRFTIGAFRRNSVSNYLSGYIAEIAFWNTALTDDEAFALENYANLKWLA